MARAPDISNQHFELSGAQAFADVLGTGKFVLSQAAEHRALPERDAALRDAGGYLSDLGAKTSTQVFETVTWDGKKLVLDGYVADATTAGPRMEGPRWSFASPAFTVPPASWKALYAKLLPLPATKTALGEAHQLELAIDQGRVRITLYRMATYDPNNQPVVRWLIDVAFGPVVTGVEPSKTHDGC